METEDLGCQAVDIKITKKSTTRTMEVAGELLFLCYIAKSCSINLQTRFLYHF